MSIKRTLQAMIFLVLFTVASAGMLPADASVIEMSYTDGIMQARANKITREMNFVMDELQGYINFLTLLHATGDTGIKRPELNMEKLKLSWLQGMPDSSDLEINPSAPEVIGEFPGKARIMTGSSNYIDRMGNYDGLPVNLDKYLKLDEYTGRYDICIGISIPEALKSYFKAPYIVRTLPEGIFATRIAVVPTGFGSYDFSNFLSKEGGDMYGDWYGGPWVTADYIHMGTPDGRTRVMPTNNLKDVLINSFESGFLRYTDLPPAIRSVYDNLLTRYQDDIVKNSGAAPYLMALSEDGELVQFVEYVKSLYVTSQEAREILFGDDISLSIFGMDFRNVFYQYGNASHVEERFTSDNILFDNPASWTDGIEIQSTSTSPNALLFSSIKIDEIENWSGAFRSISKSNNKSLFGFDNRWSFGNLWSNAVVISSVDTTKLTADVMNISGDNEIKIGVSDVFDRVTGNNEIKGQVRIGSLNSGEPVTFEVYEWNDKTTFSNIVNFTTPPVFDVAPVTSGNAFEISTQAITTPDNSVSFTGNTLNVDTIDIERSFWKSGGIKFNGKKIMRSRIDSIDVSSLNKLIPLYAFGTPRGTITSEEALEMASDIHSIVTSHYSSGGDFWDIEEKISDYLYSVLNDEFISKKTSYMHWSYAGASYADAMIDVFTENLLPFFQAHYDDYDVFLKNIDTSYSPEKITSLTGRYVFEVNGLFYEDRAIRIFGTEAPYDYAVFWYNEILKNVSVPKNSLLPSYLNGNEIQFIDISNGADVKLLSLSLTLTEPNITESEFNNLQLDDALIFNETITGNDDYWSSNNPITYALLNAKIYFKPETVFIEP